MSSEVAKLKGGIVGLGRMGITHYGILNSHPDVKITCACDNSGFVTNIFNEFKGIKVYKSYNDMLSKEDLDFIIISTPVQSHYEIIMSAMDKNIHIFCEKPFTNNLKDGQEIISSLNLKRNTSPFPLVNQVGYVNRYNAIFSHVKSLLENNIIGVVKNFFYEINGRTIIKELKSGWRTQKSSGGGCILELASHALNLLIWYFGFPKEIIGSIKQKIYSSEVEDFVHAGLVFENGIIGFLNSGWSDETLRKVTEKFEINGLKGKIIATRQLLRIYLKDACINGYNYNKGWNTVYITDVSNPVRFYLRGYEFTLQLDDFIDSIINKKEKYRNDFLSGYDSDKAINMINQNALEA